MVNRFAEHARPVACVRVLNQVITYWVMLSYPALLVYFLMKRDPMLARAIIVPLDGFLILSVFRYLINRPRPYESLPIRQVIQKNTKGKSFPSRHVFSATVIAMTFLLWSPIGWYGIILLACAILLAAIRVVTGVHYLSDVCVGALFGVLVGVLGYVVI